MRQLIIGAAILGAAALSSGFRVPGPGTTRTNPVVVSPVPWTVEAQEVLYSPPLLPQPKALRGKFTIRPAKPGDKQSIAHAVTGGACLLTQFPKADKVCSYGAECDYLGPELMPHNRRKKWFGYCLPDKDPLPGDLRLNHCWVRPDPGYCAKGKREGEHYTPAIDPAVVYREARANSGSQNPEVKWMVYGCLNGPYDLSNPASSGCTGGPNPVMHHQGPIWSSQ